MKVVIDTNCLIASIPRDKDAFWLYLAFQSRSFDWVISNEILTEYIEKLSDFYSIQTAILVSEILLIAPNIIIANPYFKWNLIHVDPDDNKFVDLAISSSSTYLVTNDHHFDVLKQLDFPSIRIVSLYEFQIIMGY